MKPVGISPAGENAPGELVHDLNLPVLNDVIHVNLKNPVGLERLREIVDVLEVLLVHDGALDQPPFLEDALHRGQSLVGEGDVPVFLVDLEVADYLLALGLVRILAVFLLLRFLKGTQQPVHLGELVGVVLGGA